MSAWLGYFPVAGRLALAAALAAAALFVLAGALRGGKARRRAVRPPRPGRRGPEELAALLERARGRPYSRDLAAERLRALARDLVALRLSSGDAAARAALDEATARAASAEALAGAGPREAGAVEGGAGAVDLDPRLLAFLAEDHFAKPAQGAEGRSYLERLDEALGLLEDYGEDLQGERP